MTRPLVAGFVGGALVATAAATVLRSAMPAMSGLNVFDPLPYAIALVGFATVVALAILSPGRRAIHIDPTTALRHD
jgi:ABC-type antimicrobial peptide transport system permease subunit